VLRAFSDDTNKPFSSAGVTTLRVAARDRHHALGSWRNVVLVVWREETQIPAIVRTSQLIGELAQRHGRIALVQIVEQTAVPPESDIRKAISDMLKKHSDHLISSAVVFEGSGFRAAGVRGVVTAISLLSRTKFPHVIFASPPAALNWTSRHLGTDGPVWTDQALRVVDELRAEIGAPAARAAASRRP
jgi:hypothetical protein